MHHHEHLLTLSHPSYAGNLRRIANSFYFLASVSEKKLADASLPLTPENSALAADSAFVELFDEYIADLLSIYELLKTAADAHPGDLDIFYHQVLVILSRVILDTHFISLQTALPKEFRDRSSLHLVQQLRYLDQLYSSFSLEFAGLLNSHETVAPEDILSELEQFDGKETAATLDELWHSLQHTFPHIKEKYSRHSI